MLVEAFPSVLLAAQQGQGWALERLWQDLGSLIAGYLRLQGAEDPDDLASEVFINLFTGIDRFRGNETCFRSWILVIAQRHLEDERRQRRHRRPSSGAEDICEGGIGGPENQQVKAMLAGLTEDQRSILSLRIVGDLTNEQVSDVVGQRRTTVRDMQRQAVASLRLAFAGTGVPL